MSAASDRRHRLLTAVLTDVARTGRADITRADDVAAEFGGPDGLLLAVHHIWWTAVDAHLDALLEDPPAEPATALADLWHDLAERHPAARTLLDAHADRPALAAAEHHRRQRLLDAIGVDVAALPASRSRRAACGVRRRLGRRRPTTTANHPLVA